MEQTAQTGVDEQQVEQAAAGLISLVRSVVREELAHFSTGSGDGGGGGGGGDPVLALCSRAHELFEAPSWKEEFNQRLEGAFQTVLPQLIKRFKAEIDERLADAQSGGGEADYKRLANSEAMKEMMDDKFRQMLLYLKQEVIPKAVQQSKG